MRSSRLKTSGEKECLKLSRSPGSSGGSNGSQPGVRQQKYQQDATVMTQRCPVTRPETRLWCQCHDLKLRFRGSLVGETVFIVRDKRHFPACVSLPLSSIEDGWRAWRYSTVAEEGLKYYWKPGFYFFCIFFVCVCKIQGLFLKYLACVRYLPGAVGYRMCKLEPLPL